MAALIDDGLPPKPTGREAVVKLAGMLLMWKTGQPVLLRVAGQRGNCIPVFSSRETLDRAAREIALLAYESIKQIDDGQQFLEDMRAQNVRIIVDPHFGQNGRVRYLDIREQTK